MLLFGWVSKVSLAGRAPAIFVALRQVKGLGTPLRTPPLPENQVRPNPYALRAFLKETIPEQCRFRFFDVLNRTAGLRFRSHHIAVQRLTFRETRQQ